MKVDFALQVELFCLVGRDGLGVVPEEEVWRNGGDDEDDPVLGVEGLLGLEDSLCRSQ